jgi:hypothetical protein
MKFLPRLAYHIWGTDIALAIKNNEVRPAGFTGTSYAFTDREGRLYYSWPKAEHLPAARIMRVEACMVMIDAGQSPTTAEKFNKAMQDRCTSILEATNLKVIKEKAHELSFLCTEQTFRRKNLIPEEAYFDLAAICAVREDENPDLVDPVIHEQKMEAFRTAAKAGDAFFLDCPAFRAALAPLLTTAEGLRALLNSWTARLLREQAMFEVLASRTK